MVPVCFWAYLELSDCNSVNLFYSIRSLTMTPSRLLRTGVLLTHGNYYGTLAAARDLGRVGIPIRVADASRFTPTYASRYCQTHEQMSCMDDLSQTGKWLIEYGERHPGLVLYPSSDDLAWVMATHQDRLRQSYRLFQAPESAVFTLLNKASLYQAAHQFELPTPATYYPSNWDELNHLADQLKNDSGFPVIVKPKTQIGMRTNIKGLVAHDVPELVRHVTSFLEQYHHKPELLEYCPDLRWPLIQQYLPEAARQTYTVSGFISQTGELLGARASLKVLQQPVTIGIGIAFEGRPLMQRISNKILKLAHSVGYFGVFEAEFIYVEARDQYLLMDFNPRYYGQMSFEIQRGLSLPQMVYAAAHGDRAYLSELTEHAALTNANGREASQRYCVNWLFRFLLFAQKMGQKISPADEAKWLNWANAGELFDAVADQQDPWPKRIDQGLLALKFFKHPRSSYRHHFT